MGKKTPEERIDQLKKILADEQVSTLDKMVYAYHAVLLEWGIWRQNQAKEFIQKHGAKLNETVDIIVFVKKLDDL